MKTLPLNALLTTLWILTHSSTIAQFDSGSDGSDGALNVTEDTTLDLPPDGIFHFTTINVDAAATLTFNPNALNTPPHLLATGDVTIDGEIDISGEDGQTNPPRGGVGGPGGYRGGDPGITSSGVLPGAGQGPGAGKGESMTGNSVADRAGGAAFAITGGPIGSINNGRVYGNALLIPMTTGGSGGGGDTADPGIGGGGGAGGILLASNTRIEVTGQILARAGAGGLGTLNSGSGGAIRLVAPEVLGSGTLDVGQKLGVGGHGYIRIDALDRSGIDFSFRPARAVTMGIAMIAIPSPLPRLDIIEAAGTQIAEATPDAVIVTLPFGADPNRTVVVQVRDFNAEVPIRVVLTPEHGESSSVDAVIDNKTVNPAQATVDVTFPINVSTAVHVWTR